jgi:hypothetical protein
MIRKPGPIILQTILRRAHSKWRKYYVRGCREEQRFFYALLGNLNTPSINLHSKHSQDDTRVSGGGIGV